MTKIFWIFLLLSLFSNPLQAQLYGLTEEGGASNDGVLFSYDPNSNVYVKLLDFNGANGWAPLGSLTKALNGKLYGLTEVGGAYGYGALFDIDPASGTYTKDYDFNISLNGQYPIGGVTLGPHGLLYGTTLGGGGNGVGVLFSFDPTSGSYTRLFDFGGINGNNPYGPLTLASDGKLYGVTPQGGAFGDGVLFSFDPSSGIYTRLVDFGFGVGSLNGVQPYASLIQASNGKLYGTTISGGANSLGVLYDYDPSSGIYTRDFDFGGVNGYYAYGCLTQASDGKLYGLAEEGGANGYGTLYNYDPSSGTFAKLLDFGGANGTYPIDGLDVASNGKLYGMTSSGGVNGVGVLFDYDPSSGAANVDLNFNGGNGAYPAFGSLLSIGLPFPIATSGTSVSQISFQANWGSSPGATGYYLDVATSSTFSSYVPGYQNLSVGNVTTYLLTNLSSGTTYYYRVRAAGTIGTSTNSIPISVLTLPATPVADAASATSQTVFTANWNAQPDASSFFIDVATDAGFTSILPSYNNLSAATNSITVGGLLPNTTYYYQVRAANATGSSPSSNLITVQTLSPPPVVSSFSPSSGSIGTSVTITGVGFSSTQANNIVYFGAVRAAVTSASATSLVVVVPPGTSNNPITVEVNGLQGFSNTPFVVTFAGNHFDANSLAPNADISTSAQNPVFVTFGDIDGDGKADMVVTNGSISTVSVFQNISVTGTITAASFSPPFDLATPAPPAGAVLGDIDGDGKLDIVLGIPSANTISIFKNTSGLGALTTNSFAPRVDISTGSNPNYLAINDIDGDGMPDIISPMTGSNVVSIYRNVGPSGIISSSTFAPVVDIATNLAPLGIAVKDLDGDGKPDIVVGNLGGASISTFKNIGFSGVISTNSFASKIDYVTGQRPTVIDVDDFDGDGIPDIAAGIETDGALAVLRGAGNGTFSSPVEFTSGTSPDGLAVSDMNGDGKLDIAVSNFSSNAVSLFINASTSGSITSGSFSTVHFSAPSRPYGVALQDVDGDGKTDLAVADDGTNTVSIFRNALALPIINSFAPTSGSPGNLITITGTGFTEASSVTFGGVPSLAFTIVSSTTINATVGAAGSGNIVVTTPEGTSTFSGFTFTPPPSISSFSPTSGQVGTAVTITGSGFSSTAASNMVYFGAVKSTVTLASTTQLTVTVPVGASNTPITVEANGLQASSGQPFDVTSSGNNNVVLNHTADVLAPASPYSVAFGDIDGDGKPDMVVPNGIALSVYQNISSSGSLGTNSFGASVDLNTGSYPYWAKLIDIDGDGKLDLAATNPGISTISIFRNISSGGPISLSSFAPRIDINSENSPYVLDIADIDGDGKPDLITTSRSNNTLVIIGNKSSPGNITPASFAPSVDFGTLSQPTGVAVGDLNGDGKKDIVVGNLNQASLSVYISNGAPYVVSFSRTDYPTSPRPTYIALSDFDGDGKLDVAVGLETYGMLLVIPGNGDGTLGAGTEYPCGTSPDGLTIGDLNGDGKQDIVVSNFSDNTISTFVNTSSPGYININSFTRSNYFTLGRPYGVAVQDIDGDGRADVAVATNGTTNVSLFKNITQLTVTSCSPLSGPVGTAVSIAGSGFDLTPSNNIVYFGAVKASVTQVSSTLLTVTVPAGASYAPISVEVNGFQASSNSPFDVTFISSHEVNIGLLSPESDITAGVNPYAAAFGDFDSDGKPDLVVTNYGSSKITVYKNISTTGTVNSGSFATGFDLATGANPFNVAIGDLDGDGMLDLAVTSLGANVSVYRNTSGGGSMSFAPPISFPAGNSPWGIAIRDMDGDGRPEVIGTNINSNTAYVYWNRSVPGLIDENSFNYITTLFTDANPYGIVAGDIDGDGKPEVATINYSGASISIFRNTSLPGAGFFDAETSLPIGVNSLFLALNDVDGDGKLDLVYTGNSGVVVLPNTSSAGTFSFGSSTTLALGSSPYAVALSDMDGDGKQDLLATSAGSNALTIFKNLSTPGDLRASNGVIFSTGTYPTILAAEDIDGDGRPDVAVPDYNSSAVSLHQNLISPPPPTITSFTPATGAVGSAVTINGTYFGATPASNVVYFGAVAATVTQASSTQLTVVVPNGATYQPLSVTTSGATALSTEPFIPTFAGANVDPNAFAPRVDFATGNNPYSVSILDFDGDGKPDMISNGGPLALHQNTASPGSITSNSFATKVNFPTGGNGPNVGVADFDGDGKKDIVVIGVHVTGSTVATGISVYRNVSSSGTISQNSFATNVDFITGVNSRFIDIGDLDFDGKPDVVVTDLTNNVVSILKNISTVGTIAFAPQVDLSTLQQPICVVINDVDGDGKNDLVVASSSAGYFSVYRNTTSVGNPFSFASRADILSPTVLYAAMADLDGDAKNDLLLFNSGVVTYKNTSSTGSISFAASISLLNGVYAQSGTVGDVNGDGKPDLVVGDFNNNMVDVFQNTSANNTINFATPVSFSTANSPINVAIGDLDGDGKPELAVADYDGSSNAISVFHNQITNVQTTTFGGDIWGMTQSGGAGFGVIFKYSPSSGTYTNVYSFDGGANGNSPMAGLTLSSNGKLYGMTEQGGANNNGVLFEYDPGTGAFAKDFDFGGPNGANPYGSLIQSTNGMLYGMTIYGGPNGYGAIFEYNPASGTYTKVHEFDLTNGAYPFASLIQGTNGKLYGMTEQGGANNYGVLFEFDPATGTYTKDYDFDLINGANPYGSLMQGTNGKLYGMTYNGGANHSGVLFEYDPVTGNFAKDFDFGGVNGQYPYGRLMQGTNGKLYGMTSSGGANSSGVLFEYDPGTNTFANDFNFGGTNGIYPYGCLTQDTNGKLYGVTLQGGANNIGVLFEYDPASSTFTKKFDFNGTNGASPNFEELVVLVNQQPSTPVAIAATSVTQSVFTANWNTVSGATNYFIDVATDPCFSNILSNYNNISVSTNSFSVTSLSASSPYYYYRVRASNASGTSLSSNVITVSTLPNSLGSGGELWGMTQYGGAGYGVIFKYSPTSGTYTDEFHFDGGAYGNGPLGELTLAPNGKLYGTAEQAGANGVGVLFSIDPATSIYTKVYDFNVTDGAYPTGRVLTLASNGKLYGTTYQGGNSNLGVLFEFDPVAGTYKKDYDFNGTNGGNPFNTLVQAPDGKLYGMTQSGGANSVGVLFQYDPATTTLTKKWDFNATGQSPYGGLTVGGDGNLYGMTYAGGTSGLGVLFQFIPCSGEFLVVHNFGGPDGAYGYANLTLATNGKLYGMTYGGGLGYGVVFEYDPSTKTYTNDYNFDATNGSYPYGSLTQYSDGQLYGMTHDGGANGLGVLFKFDPVAKTYSKISDFNNVNGAHPVGGALTTVIQIPSVPVATKATSIDATDFTANWNTVSGASNYFIDVTTDPGFTAILSSYNNLSVTNNSLLVNGLTAGTTYYYQVRAANSAGSSPSSNSISTLTLPPAPVTISATSIGQFSFVANWSLSQSATDYILDVATDPGFTLMVPGYSALDLGNVTTSYNVNLNLTVGTVYYYRVRAVNSSGVSSNSNVSSVQTLSMFPQTITFNSISPVTYGVPSFSLTATASSGLGVTYSSSNPAVATVIGNVVSVVGVGVTTITASQLGNLNYLPATNVIQILTVNPIGQTITFSPLSPVTVGYPFSLNATGGASGQPVTFSSSNPTIASVSGNRVTPTGAGSATITASQASNSFYNAAGNVSQSLTVYPQAPVYIITPANNAINQNVTLNLTANLISGATTYTIEINTASDFSGIDQIQSGARTQSFSGLLYSTQYFVRVKTNLAPGWGKETTFITGAPEYFSYVTTPTNNSTGVLLTNLSLNVTSNLVINATQYTIELNTSPTFSGGISIVKTGAKTLTFSGLTPLTIYYSRVMTNLSPNWGKTQQFTTATMQQLSYVLTPANSSVNNSYDPSIVVNITGASNYTIQLSADITFLTGILQQSGPSPTFAYSGLAYNTKYYSRVSSDLGASWGPTKNFTTADPLYFSYLTSPINASTGINVLTNITANLVPGATTYTIEANTAPDFSGTSIVKTGAARTYAYSLAYSQTYYVRVQTNLMAGQWGATKSFTTGDPVSLAYVVTPANNAVNQHLTLNVSANNLPGATSYTIELNTASDFSGNSIIKTSASRTISFSGLKNALTYFTRVQTSLATNLWGPTKQFSTVLTGTRIESDAVASSDSLQVEPPVLQVFPNPFSKTITIHLQTLNEQLANFVLFDLTGRPVREFKGMTNQVIEVDGSDLAQGIYLLKVTSGEINSTVKIVRE